MEIKHSPSAGALIRYVRELLMASLSLTAGCSGSTLKVDELLLKRIFFPPRLNPGNQLVCVCVCVCVSVSPVGAGSPLLHPLLPSPPLARPGPLLGAALRAVRNTVRPAAAPVTDPGEILLPGDGPGFEILLVLGDAGKRHFGRVVVLPGLVTGLFTRPGRPPGARAICLRPWGATPLRVVRGNLLGDGPDLLVGDFRVVLDGERDGQIRLVELVPEASEAAHSADARPSHARQAVRLVGERRGQEESKKRREKEQKAVAGYIRAAHDAPAACQNGRKHRVPESLSAG